MTNNPVDDWFDDFWEMYPKKVVKKLAKKAWEKIKPDQALKEKIMQALRRHCKTWDWQKQDGTFVPYPATWLNQERWNDIVKVSAEIVNKQGVEEAARKLRKQYGVIDFRDSKED